MFLLWIICLYYHGALFFHFVLSFFFSLTVYRNVRMESFNKKMTFIQGFVPCVKQLGGFNIFSLSHWGEGGQSQSLPRGFSLEFQVNLKSRIFYPFSRVTVVWGPLHGECQECHGICIQDEVVTLKIDAWASAPFPYPMYYELAMSRMKRGGVISYRPHWCDQYLHCWNTNIDFHTPSIPLHWTFTILSIQEALENVCMNAWSFLFTHPRGV